MRRVFGHYVAIPTLVLGLVEAALIAGSCGAAYYYVSSGSTYQSGTIAIGSLAFLMALVMVGLMHSGGLYEASTLFNLKRTVWRLSLITVPMFVLAVWTTGHLARSGTIQIYPYRWQWTLALTGVWLATAIMLRAAFVHFYRSGRLTNRVLVVGPPSLVRELSDLELETRRRFVVVASRSVNQIDLTSEKLVQLFDASRSELSALASEMRASELVIAGDGDDGTPWTTLPDSRFAGIKVTNYLDFFERESGRICLEALRDDWFAIARGFGLKKSQERIGRIFDVAFSILAIVATAPVMLLTALAIKLEDGGTVLYSQERTGLHGRTFVVLKFRSMREDAEQDGTPAWAVERDHRITRVGRIIRKLRIDELPQFINVLRGDMAIIGPRPERPYFVAQFAESIPFYQYRHAVRPGITGWAQVKFRYGASLDDTKRKLSYDLYYVRNKSVVLDLIILLKTVGVVLRGEGAR